MTVVYDRWGVTVHHGDALDVLREMSDASIHAVVTDPPYNLSFMGREWDSFTSSEHVAGHPFQKWCQTWAVECLRVLRPGGHLLAFGGTRTFHRLTCGIEDAGFEIRDTITWIYGTGFPKSLDVSKAIDKAAGAERAVIGEWNMPGRGSRSVEQAFDITKDSGTITAPATYAAKQWSGWGTALKPASEPIIVARRPLSGTVAATVLEHGTAGLNIDASRVGNGGAKKWSAPRGGIWTTDASATADLIDSGQGRWPANVVLTHGPECGRQHSGEPLWVSGGPGKSGFEDYRWQCGCGHRYGNATRQGGDVTVQHAAHLKSVSQCQSDCPVAELDAESETARSSGVYTGDGSRRPGEHSTNFGGGHRPATMYADSGGASRFFPVFRWEEKAPTRERPMVNGRSHPTVKPVDLMRWLVRLVCPPGGVVLDPFAGSGATLQAARAEGFRAVGIEREPSRPGADDYIAMLKARLDARPREETPAPAAAEPAANNGGQGDLLDLLGGGS